MLGKDKAKFEKASQLAFIRQQSIDSFLSFGGKVGNSVLSSLSLSSSSKRAHLCCHASACNFSRDPKVVTHPLYMTSLSRRGCHRDTEPKPCDNQPISLDQLINDIYASKLTPKLTLQTFSSDIGQSFSNRMGIEEFSLDHDGALLAVGHQSGYVSFYDLDEVFFKIMTNPIGVSLASLQPMVSLDTKKSISRIVWRKSSPDDIFIAFHFAPQIHQFNLNQFVSSTSSSSAPSSVFLPEGKGNQGGGHRCMVLWTRKMKIGPNSSYKEDEFIIAGSTNGYLRCWKVSSGQQASGQRSVNKGLWNVRNDVSRPKETARPVIALFLLPHYPLSLTSNTSISEEPGATHLLAVTDDGLFTVWDVIRLVPGSFGATGNEPTFITSFTLADRLCLSPTANHRLIRSIQCKENDFTRLLIQLEDGSIFTFNLFNRKLQGSPYQYHATLPSIDSLMSELALMSKLSATNTQAFSSINANTSHPIRLSDAITTSSYEALGQALSQRSITAQIPISANCCMLASSDVLVLPASILSAAQLTAPTTSTPLQRINIDTTYHNPYIHLSTNHYYNQRSCLYYRNVYTGLIESSLLRCSTMTYTLPGFLLSAVKGEKEILVSIDLQGYLGNDYVSSNCLSRSNDIRIEWYDVNGKQGYDNESGRLLGFIDYTIETVRQNYIQLATPYEGPEVVQGYPRVWIRTNLTMKGWAHDSHYHTEMIDQTSKVQKGIVSSSMTRLNQHWPRRREWDVQDIVKIEEEGGGSSMVNPVVAMFHHPYYPIMLLGHLDDSITVMSYEGRYNYTEEEENLSRTFRTNEVVHYSNLPSEQIHVNESIEETDNTSTAVEAFGVEIVEVEEAMNHNQGNAQQEDDDELEIEGIQEVVPVEAETMVEGLKEKEKAKPTDESERFPFMIDPENDFPLIPTSLQDRRQSLKQLLQSNSRNQPSYSLPKKEDAVMSTVKSMFGSSRLEGRENKPSNKNTINQKRESEKSKDDSNDIAEAKKKRKLSHPTQSSSTSSSKITQFFTKK